MIMSFGPLDEDARLGPSEFDDDDLAWAGKGDLGVSKGRKPTGGELAAEVRRNADIAAGRREPD
jgi:hypothetical protein